MQISTDQLLGVLPPFNNKSVLIESAQDVPDIVREVMAAHEYFSDDYNYIWQFFYNDSLEQTCRNLFTFCKNNIAYVVEGEDRQTTKSPSAILAMEHGDCKHYAGFIAGVLSAIERNTGEHISIRYRFASYTILERSPGHVFVVVYDKGKEYWIDPVLDRFNERLQPSYIIDKKIKSMPLYRLSGVGSADYYNEAVALLGCYQPSPVDTVGYIDPVTAATVVDTFINLFGGDKVPNYPVKEISTLNSLKASIVEHVGVMPPTSVEQAQQMLSKAIARQAYETSIGHGTGDGPGWDTLQMLYNEIILALRNYIASGGTGLPATYPTATASANTGMFSSPLLLVGLAAAVIYFITRKSR